MEYYIFMYICIKINTMKFRAYTILFAFLVFGISYFIYSIDRGNIFVTPLIDYYDMVLIGTACSTFSLVMLGGIFTEFINIYLQKED